MEQTEKQSAQTSKYYRRKLITSYFSSTLCVALVLYMAGLFFMLLLNTQHISDMFKSSLKMTISLKQNCSQADIDQFRKTLGNCQFVRDTEYISKDDAAEELSKELGEDFMEILGRNPLFSQIDIKVTDEYTNTDSIKSLERQLKNYEVVDEVYYPKDVMRNTTTVISKIASVVLILTIILLIITVILISNTIRLQMSGDRFDIHTAKLIGAPALRIIRPYLKHSLIQALIAVAISLLGLTVTIKYLEQILNGVFKIEAFYTCMIAMVALGMLVTLAAALFSIRKYLNAKEDELYY